MTAGRPPKPAKTKKPGKPKPPSQLKGRALDEWKRVVPELVKLQILSKIDGAELAFYCITYGRWQDSEDIVAEEGTLITTKSGNLIQHPALGVANTAMKMCHRFAVEFGFTPSSRRRVPTGNTEKSPEELDF